MVKQRDILTRNQILDLINNAKSFKLQLIIKTMVQTGMRVSELVNLKIEWINFKDNIMYIQKNDEPFEWSPKRDSVRKVPVKENLLTDIKRLIKNRKTGYVFQSQKKTTNGKRTNQRYTYRAIIKKINTLSQDVFGKKIGSHIFRATYTTYQIKNGMNILDIKKLLGHSSIKTTEKYIGDLPDLTSFDKVRSSEIMDL